jgi:hypothetical protein
MSLIKDLACAITPAQVFEASRTRPFHYRCFNLEAMIVSGRGSGRAPLPLHVDLCKACGLIGGRLLDEEDQVWCTDPNRSRLYDYDQSRTRRPYLCLPACYCCGGGLWRPDREVQAVYAAGPTKWPEPGEGVLLFLQPATSLRHEPS